MKYIIIALTVLFANNAYANNLYKMDCEVVKQISPEIKRCENSEVVCYVGARGNFGNCIKKKG